MKRFAVPIMIAVIVLFGAIQFSRRSSARIEAAEKAAAVATLQRDYQERVGWIRSIPDEKAYKDEVNTFFRWYFGEVATFHKAFKGNPEFDDYLQEIESRAKPGQEAQVAERKAYYAYVKKAFDAMRSGNYSPVWTGTAQGLRLDVISTDVEMVAGTPKVRFQVALWGAQRDLKSDGKLKRMITSSNFNASWKLLGPKGKFLYQIDAAGDPSMKVDWPERFIAEFPPQVVLGHYDLDLIPADVSDVEISFTVSSRSATGGDATAALTWKLPVPSEWKLKEGESWKDATVSEREVDEINGTAAAQ